MYWGGLNPPEFPYNEIWWEHQNWAKIYSWLISDIKHWDILLFPVNCWPHFMGKMSCNGAQMHMKPWTLLAFSLAFAFFPFCSFLFTGKQICLFLVIYTCLISVLSLTKRFNPIFFPFLFFFLGEAPHAISFWPYIQHKKSVCGLSDFYQTATWFQHCLIGKPQKIKQNKILLPNHVDVLLHTVEYPSR